MPFTQRDAIKLIRRHGGVFYDHGKRHELYVLQDGTKIAVPRHAGDLSPGVEREIKRKLGL